LISFAESRAESAIGTIWSSSPCKDQRRYIKFLQVLGLIGLGKGLDARVGSRKPGHHPRQPERFACALRNLGARPVVAVERRGEILEELRTAGLDAGADPVGARYLA